MHCFYPARQLQHPVAECLVRALGDERWRNPIQAACVFRVQFDGLGEVRKSQAVFFQKEVSGCAPSENITFVRYMVQRKSGASTWNETRTKLLGLPIEVVPVDQDVAEIAGEFRVSRKMSLADCFAAALAKDRNADVYTGDPEFRGVEKEVKIVWM